MTRVFMVFNGGFPYIISKPQKYHFDAKQRIG